MIAVAELADAVAEADSRAEAAQRACEHLAEAAGVAGAALYRERDGRVERLASAGDAAPPEALHGDPPAPVSERLAAWAREADFATVDVQPIGRGWLVLYGDGPHWPPDELVRLGRAAAVLVERAAAVEGLRRAHDEQVRNERMRALGEMALGVAHDINNVLNAILGQVGVLELRVGAKGELQPVIARLKRAAREGAETVGRLADFSRQRRDQEFVEVDLGALTGKALAALQKSGLPGLTVESRLQPAVVAGNPAELREVIDALVSNAVEAMARADGAGGCLTVELETRGEDVLLTVADDGVGMSREVRERAFDPYFTTKADASGLGLSVAYGVVRRHGGRIALESAPARGTAVRVRLPALTRALAPAPTVEATPSNAVPTSARVLLVEDDLDNREAMAELMRLGGHDVTAVGTGADALRGFSRGAFDLVVTDLGLPDMSGWEVARSVKEASPATPVALVTGWGLNLERDEIRRRGVDLLIQKPLDPRKFLDRLGALAALAQPLTTPARSR